MDGFTLSRTADKFVKLWLCVLGKGTNDVQPDLPLSTKEAQSFSGEEGDVGYPIEDTWELTPPFGSREFFAAFWRLPGNQNCLGVGFRVVP